MKWLVLHQLHNGTKLLMLPNHVYETGTGTFVNGFQVVETFDEIANQLDAVTILEDEQAQKRIVPKTQSYQIGSSRGSSVGF